jgi:ribosomal protein S19
VSILFHNNVILKKKNKTNYFSYKIWRLSYLLNLNSIYHNMEKKIHSRSSTIPYSFLNYEILVYNGTKWIKRRSNYWMIGYKFGEFTWNRKYALYKAKSKKKKKK